MGRYICKIELTVLGPFLTAGTGSSSYGLDRFFHRDWQGKLVIPASHIKGKVRMALEELAPFFPEEGERPDIDKWFGVGSDEGDFSFAPAPGLLSFSDLDCANGAKDGTRTRVTIEPLTSTAQEQHLQIAEDVFGSGEKVVFKGIISFYASSDEQAQSIASVLRVGLSWLPNLGGDKGIGYGRLLSVDVSKAEGERYDHLAMPTLTDSDSLCLRIVPLEPFMVGGVRNRRSNYIGSEREITGGVIKGALAASLNQAHDVDALYRKIDEIHGADFPNYQLLVKHFSQIRITQALPALRGEARPVRIPLSTVQHNGAFWDTALADDETPLIDEQAPVYAIDWKEGQAYWGAASPAMEYVTRAEIDDGSQRTLENRLFTYVFCCPKDEDEQDLEWVCSVNFSQVPEADRAETKRQFADAVRRYLRRVGKLSRMMQVIIEDGAAPAAKPSKLEAIQTDGIVLITLQSDALMLDANQVRELGSGEDLHELYAAYWAEVSGADGSSSCLELETFYAQQVFRGGYLYHRYLGTAEADSDQRRYRPYYLTGTGSVFKLRVTDAERATALVERWMKQGLPWPHWAALEYGQGEQDVWENCPFVPGNGYGEIAVNLAWHWEKAIV